ncbi:MAG: orotate phosphoribosyltransferase [Candidatus Accumulibacter sp.]|jgi:orotate phosphoribosyltransferase|nr:orotate phosphoribosyltransferase [Accumulibacter sp.]
MDFHLEFIEFILASKVLRFGEFKIKSGRLSPYFFNAGLFNDGQRLDRLSQFYARAVLDSGIPVDALFGPAYKGIPLVVGCAMALARSGKNLPYAFNRKEAKDHGEGGMLIGAPLSGNVLIIDDVISAGTSVRESIDLIRAAGATPCGVVIALDRMERGTRELSAVQEVQRDFGVPVVAIATLDDLTAYLRGHPDFKTHETRILRYRQEYGIENLD